MELEDGITFGQFFNIILKHHKEYSEFFSMFLGGISLSEYITEFNSLSNSDETDEIDKIDYICVHWYTKHILPHEINDPINIEKMPSFSGFKYGQNTFNETGYSLEFTPINKLKKYPLKLITNHIIADMNSSKTLFTLERKLLTFDVLISIFNEITIMGPPMERNQILNKLKNKSDNFKYKTTSLEDFLKKIKIDLPR